jgi:alkanesulfonate monooxygenase SsuD/methylene tetrahydromethanopterin reductase-like flavin-dependent oxidoreductase (luciferase family)
VPATVPGPDMSHAPATVPAQGTTPAPAASSAIAAPTAPAAPPAPEVLVSCTSPGSVRLAAEHGLPMLLGMHSDDQEKADMVTLWRSHAHAAGRSREEIMEAGHVSAGVVQVADRTADAERVLLRAMPEWFRQGLGAHLTVDGRPRPMRAPRPYTELLCGLHPVGSPALCADRLAATARHTGITRFALLAEGSGDLATTEENVRRLGTEVLPQLI